MPLPSDARPRFVPDAPLPPYSYIPGRLPHPISDPAGHRFGKTPEHSPAPDPDYWQANRAYLYGVDLFNFGYYWEAHEGWEGLWLASGRTGPRADFFRGLIKLTAAGVKVRQGIPAGVASHAERAAVAFRRVVSDYYFGLHISDLLSYCLGVKAMAPAAIGDREEGVKIVFPFVLRPR